MIAEEEKMSYTELVELIKKNAVIQSREVYETALRVRPDDFLFELPDTPPTTMDNNDVQRNDGDKVLACDCNHEGRDEENELFPSLTVEERAEATAEALITYFTCLELLRHGLRRGMRALDLGSGSGYFTVCMAHMVGPGGLVVGVDINGDFLAHAAHVVNCCYPEFKSIIKWRQRDAYCGCPEFAPYSAIHVGGAVEFVPETWIDQLVVGGVMTVPVTQPNSANTEKETRLFAIKKTGTHKIRQTELFQVFYEPLVELCALSRSPAIHISVDTSECNNEESEPAKGSSSR